VPECADKCVDIIETRAEGFIAVYEGLPRRWGTTGRAILRIDLNYAVR
jgi:hypothetical protein